MVPIRKNIVPQVGTVMATSSMQKISTRSALERDKRRLIRPTTALTRTVTMRNRMAPGEAGAKPTPL